MDDTITKLRNALLLIMYMTNTQLLLLYCCSYLVRRVRTQFKAWATMQIPIKVAGSSTWRQILLRHIASDSI